MKRVLVLLLSASIALVACAKEPAPTSSGGSVASTKDPGVSVENDAVQAIVEATRTTLAAGSVRMDFTMSVGAGGQSFDFSGTGEADFRAGRQRMTMEFPSFAPGTPAGEMEMILDGTVMYMRAPFLTKVGGIDGWIKADLREFGDVSSLTGPQGDPSQSLSFLAGALDAEELGPDHVAGMPATHYRATVDILKAVDQVPADVRDTVEASAEQFRSQFGFSEIPIEVWIGEDGHILRQQMHLDILPTAGLGSAGGSMEMVIAYSDFGVRVDVRPPPPSQVTDFSELASGLP